MAALKNHLENKGYEHVTPYINSGNILVDTPKGAETVKTDVEKILADEFHMDPMVNKVLVLKQTYLKSVVENKPKGFGEEPEKYYSDAIFLIDIDVDEAMKVFNPREGVDKVWPGKGVIYSQRLGSQRTKSRLGKIVGTPAYKCMTIRSWNTIAKLLTLMEK